MFKARPRVAARELALQLLVDAEHPVDGALAVGVRGELKAGKPRLSRGLVQALAGAELQPRVVRDADVRLREPGRALRDRAARELLDAADAQHRVTEAGVDAGGDIAVEVRRVDVAVGAKAQLARIARVLERLDALGIGVGLADRRDALAGVVLRDQRHGAAVLLARDVVGDRREHRLVGPVGDAAVEPAGGGALEASAGRIGRRGRGTQRGERERVDVRAVAAAVLDDDRVVGHGGIEIGARQGARRLAVVVEVAAHPGAGRGARRPLMQRRQNFLDRRFVAGHVPQLVDAIEPRVRGPASASTSRSSPTATKRPLLMATAVAAGRPVATVCSSPW